LQSVQPVTHSPSQREPASIFSGCGAYPATHDANLPDRKDDDDLRDYGFTPVQMGGRGARKQDDDEEEEDREREEPKPAPAPEPVEPKG
jgi:hypothetical protein